MSADALAELLHGYRQEYEKLGFDYHFAVLLAWRRFARRRQWGERQF